MSQRMAPFFDAVRGFGDRTLRGILLRGVVAFCATAAAGVLGGVIGAQELTGRWPVPGAVALIIGIALAAGTVADHLVMAVSVRRALKRLPITLPIAVSGTVWAIVQSSLDFGAVVDTLTGARRRKPPAT
ncbi:MAG TPA: hypothetical protein VIC85_18660 [Ktedonobacterales bacterium]